MFIKEIKTKNFKTLKGENFIKCNTPNGEIGSGLNIFVGENNSGKSTMMEAAYCLRQKPNKSLMTLGLNTENEESYTEITFISNNINEIIDNFVQENKRDSFKNLVYSKNKEKYLTIQRKTNDKDTAKKIYFYSNEDNVYKNNPGGLDASIQAFFQISNIWANTNPTDEVKYGSASICGNLLSDISDKFKINHKNQYDTFIKEFNKLFNDPKSGLQSDLNSVAKETEEILQSQFGRATLDFRFDDPEPDLLFKRIKILVNDGENTEIHEKGHGMQRAVILSLLQVYAKRITEIENENGEIQLKPHFLFIDEPELGLHPQAQKKLFNALLQLSKTHQVFISTHSENFISVKNLINIYKFPKINNNIEIINLDNKNEITLPENRKFFLHHHKLFFAKKAIFFEGADDYETFSEYLIKNKKEYLVKDCYFMGGCNNFKMFKDFCEKFHIKYIFIFDVDVLSKSNNALKNFNPNIRDRILKMNILATKKDPSNLLDQNLSQENIEKKESLISDLEKENMFVLKNGAIEQYIPDILGTNITEKTKELDSIFSKIENLLN